MQKLKSTSSGYIMLKTGMEGPRHDPYSFEEWTFCRNGEKTILREGLASWIEIRGKRYSNFDLCVLNNRDDENACTHEFERIIGMKMKVLERVIHRPSHCCAKQKLEWESGYPGESLLICQTCHSIVNSYFSESAII